MIKKLLALSVACLASLPGCFLARMNARHQQEQETQEQNAKMRAQSDAAIAAQNKNITKQLITCKPRKSFPQAESLLAQVAAKWASDHPHEPKVRYTLTDAPSWVKDTDAGQDQYGRPIEIEHRLLNTRIYTEDSVEHKCFVVIGTMDQQRDTGDWYFPKFVTLPQMVAPVPCSSLATPPSTWPQCPAWEQTAPAP